MKNRTTIDSFNNAINGIVKALKSERNFRIHIGISVVVFFCAYYFEISKTELLVLSITIFLVIILELVNTAIEYTLDAMFKEYNIYVKHAKDISAGAVMVSSINAVIIGTVIFGEKIIDFTDVYFEKLNGLNPLVLLVLFFIVITLTVIIKIKSGRGTPMRGGLPSGHTAIAFVIATLISAYGRNSVIIILSYVLAFLVAQSRYEGKIHTVVEVISGAVLGIVIAILFLNITNFVK